MYKFMPNNKTRRTVLALVEALALVIAAPFAANAQDPARPNGPQASHDSKQLDNSDQSLADQLRELQTKVAELEAALQQNHRATADSADNSSHPANQDMGSMQSGSDAGEMGMGGMAEMSMMGGSGQGMSSMSSMREMGMMGAEGMSMMGRMQGMGQMQMPSALPGFPGASHIYHVGSTNFFLDHPQHITLSQEQQTKLNQLKQKTMLGRATFDRWIDAAEQELWVLTSSDAPDAAKIEAKVGEIEELRGEKRIAFIRAVGEAANVLTPEQRQTLVGTLPPDHAASGGNDQH